MKVEINSVEHCVGRDACASCNDPPGREVGSGFSKNKKLLNALLGLS